MWQCDTWTFWQCDTCDTRILWPCNTSDTLIFCDDVTLVTLTVCDNNVTLSKWDFLSNFPTPCNSFKVITKEIIKLTYLRIFGWQSLFINWTSLSMLFRLDLCLFNFKTITLWLVLCVTCKIRIFLVKLCSLLLSIRISQ